MARLSDGFHAQHARKHVFEENYLSELLRTDQPRSLEEVFSAQIRDLTKDFDGRSHPACGCHTIEELPQPKKDFSTYRDALEFAQKNCIHSNAETLLHGREWVCNDCNRIIGVEEMKRIARNRNPFMWGF